MKRLYALMVTVMMAAMACSGGGSTSNTPLPSGSLNSSLKVLASNVIMSTANASDLAGVDTATKVLASNVTVDTKGLAVSSTNVQDVFAEVEPDLATMLPGTWKVTQVTRTVSTSGSTLPTTDTGTTVTFNADGTYTLIIGVANASNNFSSIANTAGASVFKYTIIENCIVSFQVMTSVTSGGASSSKDITVGSTSTYPVTVLRKIGTSKLVIQEQNGNASVLVKQ